MPNNRIICLRLSIIVESRSFGWKWLLCHTIGFARHTKFLLWSTITLRKLIGFAQNTSHSIAFVSLHKHMLPKTCILRWNIMFYNENTWFFETLVYFIEQKCQFFAKLIDYTEITYFLTVIINYGWNHEVFAENECFFKKWKSTRRKILSNSVDNSSKIHRIQAKRVSFDSIRFTLQVRTKNMHLSVKSQVLHRKTLFFREFRQLNRKTLRICRIIVFSDRDYQL